MEKAVIRCTLDLMISLRDSTTGLAVEERNVRFVKDDKNIVGRAKGQGTYIFLNGGREDCLMQIEVYGYEPKTIDVCYEKLDKVLPSIDVYLIPSENTSRGEDILTLKGRLSGLESLEAIHPGRAVTSVRELDVKKRIITIFSPNRRVNLMEAKYGLFDAGKTSFESLEIQEELSEKKFRLRNNPEGEFIPNSPLCRIIYGQVEKDGSYLFRVRNDGKSLKYLIKYVVDGQTRYKVVDFAQDNISKLD